MGDDKQEGNETQVKAINAGGKKIRGGITGYERELTFKVTQEVIRSRWKM